MAQQLRHGERVTVTGVLFDMDGTLIDSTRAVEESWRQWAQQIALPTPTPDLHGRTARDLVRVMGVDEADRDRVEKLLEDIESRAGQEIAAMPGALEALRVIPRGRWGIVTSATRRVAHCRLAAAGIAAPQLLVTGDDVREGKPSPEPFRLGIRALQGSTDAVSAPVAGESVAASVLCIEDSPAGLRSVRASGGFGVAVAADAHARAALAPLADLVVHSLTELRFDVVQQQLQLSWRP